MVKCVQCGKEARITLPYGPHRFCKEHFLYFFEKRARKTIRENKLVRGREKIAIALSGGKDSVTTLHLLHNIFSGSNEIVAIMVDEGIKGYRDKAIAIGKKNCKELGTDYEIVSMKKELGVSMNDIMKKISRNKELGSTCAFCGVLRRQLLNKKALEVEAKKIATGHNLDDEVQSIMMNIFDNDMPRLSRLGAIAGSSKQYGFVPRIKPLWETPENDIVEFAKLKGIEHYKKRCCPFSWMAKRNFFRRMLNEAEQNFPGTKFSILAAFRQLKPNMGGFAKKRKINRCIHCGNLTSGNECNVCIQLKKLGN